MSPHRKIFERNRLWSESFTSKHPHYFEELAKEQHPDYLFIGCSDSRVSPDLVMGNEPGKLFVHRNIANLVRTEDLSVRSVIHFAVVYLKVNYIIVCGHYGCAGIHAAMSGDDFGVLNEWLCSIQEVYENNREWIDAISDPEENHRRMVELNVQTQVQQVLNNEDVVESRKTRDGYPHVLGWVYEMDSGILHDLEKSEP